ncbi:MAG: type IV pilus modification protein PilV [Proteobacteria bacterium]|nr:type IV pilus modification protein PilV [Pseudomonadota bacterium]
MRRRHDHGFSMIEVLVSILIVSLGILALSGLLVRASTLGKTAEFRGAASLLAADIADRIRANVEGARNEKYDLTPTALATGFPKAVTPTCDATACTPEQLAAKDVADWQAALYANLPQGTGAVDYDATNHWADVWVMWRDPSAEDRSNEKIGVNMCSSQMAETEKASCMYFRVGR